MTVHKEVFVLITISQTMECLVLSSHNKRKTSILLLRKQEGDNLKWE